MPEFNQTEQEMMRQVPESNWYKVTLECGHIIYTKVRLKYEKPNRQYHNFRCGYCDSANKRTPNKPTPLSWKTVSTVETVTDAEVSDVLSGNAFILSRNIMRLDYGGGPSGNPFPYTSRDRDY